MDFREQIEGRCREMGISQSDLARRMGVKRQAVDQLKRNTFSKLRPGTRRNLCSSLEVGEEFFLSRVP